MTNGASDLVEWIRDRAEGLELETETRGTSTEYEIVLLPLPAKADYRFCLYLYSDYERGIGASLHDEDEALYFWSSQLELAGFDDYDALQAEFLHQVSLILEHPTRITQSRGILFDSFRCDARLIDRWEPISTCAALRATHHVPRIEGRRRVYHSAAVREAA
jgi:hypothetical protein